MADDEVNPLGTPTANYGWTKPVVGADVDAWGDMLNTNFDGIDSVVHGIQTSIPTVPAASTTLPVMDGVAAAGSSTAWSRGDHKHPSDTTKYDANNPAGYITALAIPAPYVLPTASTTVLGGVKVDGTTITIASGTISGAGNYALPPASTTVLGGVKVDGTTIKAAVDGMISTTVVPMGDNRIINGDMWLDQRNGGAAGTAANAYTVDRWQFDSSLATKGTWARAPLNAVPGFGFRYALNFTSTSAYTPLAADVFAFKQLIEADMVMDFAWGTPQAQPVTLSFWAYTTVGGSYSGSIRTPLAGRSYPFLYSLLASTWTKVVVTIPGDTAGTWVMSGNAAALSIDFVFGLGSTYAGPPNAWSSNNYVGAIGQTNVVATNGATFYVTGVKLETGSVATPFNRQSLAKSMADCQRYYQGIIGTQVAMSAINSGSITGPSFQYPPMRATPTVVQAGNTYGGCTGVATNPISASTVIGTVLTGCTAGASCWAQFNLALNAEL